MATGPTEEEIQALAAFTVAYDARKKAEAAEAEQLAKIAKAMQEFAASLTPATQIPVTDAQVAATSTASTQPATTTSETVTQKKGFWAGLSGR